MIFWRRMGLGGAGEGGKLVDFTVRDYNLKVVVCVNLGPGVRAVEVVIRRGFRLSGRLLLHV